MMMTATYDNIHIIHKLTTEFYQQTKEPFIQRYIPEPVMNPMQAGLLLFMLDNSKIAVSSSQSVTLAALLIQAAMDTHDRIGTAEVDSEIERKQRQLTVLAGDYYSSLYYTLLAGCGEPRFIRIMSKAVQEINEAKMRTLEAVDAGTALEHYMVVRSAMTTHLAAYLGFASAIPDLRRLFLLQSLKEKQTGFLLYSALSKSPMNKIEKTDQLHSQIVNSTKEDFGLQSKIEEEANRIYMIP
nr:hypothetical protein FTX54_13495 [Alkalicoccus halolimnae]